MTVTAAPSSPDSVTHRQPFLVFGNVHFFLSSADRAVGFSSFSILCYSFISFFLAFVYLGSGDMASFLMTEARQHNTEIRMAVSKVADKMDHLMTKVTEPSHFESRGIK